MTTDVNAAKARQELKNYWELICKPERRDLLKGEELRAVSDLVNSKTASFRYAILTQVLAKVINPSVDCRCLQKKASSIGAFDARSLCKKVVVEFDRENDRVLGGSGDPYVSKPLRHEEVSSLCRSEIKDKVGWDSLCFILARIQEENDTDFTEKVLMQVLLEIRQRQFKTTIQYPTPSRVSLAQAEKLVKEYLSVPSEGVHLEVIMASLLKTVGEVMRWHVELSKPTAPDLFMKRIADIECYDPEGKLVKAVELKDRELTKQDIEEKLPQIRARRVTQFAFVSPKGIKHGEEEDIGKIIDTEFQSGMNIYIINPIEFSRGLLILLSEEGRRKFVQNTSEVLEEQKYAYEHRKAWADLVASL